ncbi:hypothetical protein [Sphingobium sp. WCS2017Hpa-17]|uniref:hypothetical protein n=1 Tax=Sphingobium sp. WCS2017Hpa-17 TaxID=3073638 RepID=UPI0028897FB7|nr:hypothetical protein [Sphingobium sp. WCS2017Hpa-17]
MITVPQSVLAYFEQPAVQSAVDLLLAKKEPKVPDNLQWKDVPAFYRASLAARQVPIEFAIFTEELWRHVWVDVPTAWRPCAPSNPARPDLSVSAWTVWDEGCFSRRFERAGLSLELAAGLWSETGLQLGVLVYGIDGRRLLDICPLKGWDREGYDMLWTQEEIIPFGETVDLEPFKPWTDQAWEAIARATTAED